MLRHSIQSVFCSATSLHACRCRHHVWIDGVFWQIARHYVGVLGQILLAAICKPFTMSTIKDIDVGEEQAARDWHSSAN